VLWHETGGILALSESASKLLGLEDRDLPRTLEALAGLAHPEDAPALRAALDAPRSELEVRLRTSSGAWVRTGWVLNRDPEGRRGGAFRDITEVRLARLEAEARSRTQWTASLASNFARALRTPLENLRTHLGAISAGGRHLEGAQECAGILAGLLDQAALAALCEPAPDLLLELNAVVERVRPWAEGIAGPGITLGWDLEPDLPVLPISPGRLEPVLMNLLRNAREALDGQGEIRVRTFLAAPEPAGAEPPRLVLEVRDNGPGIPPRVKEQMFDPYFTTRAGARGLGLTVVRCLVEGAGGSIQVDTEPMRGTSVKVSLPL